MFKSVWLLWCLIGNTFTMNSFPTLTLDEISAVLQDTSTSSNVKNILAAILNDYMDLQYGNETPYTTGKQILPTDVTINNIEDAIADTNTNKKFKDMFIKIAEVYKTGNLTPLSPNDGTWLSTLKPVLVLIESNI